MMWYIFLCFSTNGTVINMSKLVKKQTHMLQNGDVIYFVYRKSEPEQSELLLGFHLKCKENWKISYSIFCSPDVAYVYHSIRTEQPLCQDGYGEQTAASLWCCFHVVIVSPGSCCGLGLYRRRAEVRPQSGLCLAIRETSLCGACDAHKGTVWYQPGGPSALHLKFPLLHQEPRPSHSR